ncbi:tol-pal system protein YbgF [Denitratisoma oestradiolicum]|uniref:Cell division coordinator CpoB n=1 Tax=Denitratisoma oestradiolicum TaxID=311182 RepID=A0A6S6YD06_9PROT|nr:tol-pal system protein YbgF [Denitratisoma oestradiolicum]TWO81643.1 tol-pal system protein YbgF [Denitratisoma oestradiolicum]CAB1370586.1 Cell division coordinator CpoB [Denitratisoma oestradiolicum]
MRRAGLALLLLACALPARAGLFDDDEARARIGKLQGEVSELTQRQETTGKNQVDFANQVETLNAELARLRGQIEVLTYELDAAQKRQKDFYVDLDNRLRALETSAAASAAATEGTTTPVAADPAAETDNYESALKALKASRFKEALAAFSAFIKAYPESNLQPSAHFWAGYCLNQLREPAKAADMFGRLAAQWPDDPKAPEALLAQANSLEDAGQRAAARKVLTTLAAKYPASESGKKAKQQLKKK